MKLIYSESNNNTSGYNHYSQKENSLYEVTNISRALFLDGIFQSIHIINNNSLISFCISEYYKKKLEDFDYIDSEIRESISKTYASIIINDHKIINIREVLLKVAGEYNDYDFIINVSDHKLHIRLIKLINRYELKINFNWEVSHSLDFIKDFKKTIKRAPLIIKHINDLCVDDSTIIKRLIKYSTTYISIDIDNTAKSIKEDCILLENIKKYGTNIGNNLKNPHIQKILSSIQTEKKIFIYHQGVKLTIQPQYHSNPKIIFEIFNSTAYNIDYVLKFLEACPNYDEFVFKIESLKLNNL